MQVAGLPNELEQRLENLNHLMPDSGQADTLEGEMIRAINRLLYRFYNDGDKWYTGYGIETAGPAAAFLTHCIPLNVQKELGESEWKDDLAYEAALINVTALIVAYIESKNGEYTPNKTDMYDCQTKYRKQRDDDEDYDYQPLYRRYGY